MADIATEAENAFRKKRKKDPNAEMHFLDHLEALRWHLIRSVIALLTLAGIAFANKSFIFDTLILGPKNPDFWTYRKLCELAERFSLSADLCIRQIDFKVMNMEMSGQFTKHLMVSLIAGLIAGFPYVVTEIWWFIRPALHKKERKYARGIIFYSSMLFFTGVLFGYYLVVPMSVNFLGSYQVSAEILNQISLHSYISTVSTLTLASGIIFELPIVIYFLSKLGMMTPQFMRKYRRHGFVLILFLAAIVTPSPDIPTQLMVTLPLVILYEISIFISAVVQRNKEKSMN